MRSSCGRRAGHGPTPWADPAAHGAALHRPRGPTSAHGCAYNSEHRSAHQRDDSLGRRRPGEQETLAFVAAQGGERDELLARLDALGHHGYPKGVGHRCHRGDDLAVTVAPADLGHEAPVDLQDVNVQPLQVGERGVAGPEVVERDAHPEL